MKKKTWANVVLAASAVLTAAAAPYKDISLLAEGCFHLGFASTVGGFADWFGVASLFGKPLGIGKRTDIIAKDRDKIIRLARDMITQELLTRQQIKALVVKNVPTDVLYRWILSHEAGVKNVLDAAALLSLDSLDKEKLWRFLSGKAVGAAADTDWAGQIALVLEEFRTGERSKPLIEALAREAKGFLEDECTQDEIRSIYLSAWKDYEQNGFLRGLLRSHMEDKTEEVTTLIRRELLKLADSLTEEGSPARAWIDEKCMEIIRALEDDKDVKRRVNNFITEKVVVLLAGKGKETAFRLWEKKKKWRPCAFRKVRFPSSRQVLPMRRNAAPSMPSSSALSCRSSRRFMNRSGMPSRTSSPLWMEGRWQTLRRKLSPRTPLPSV